MLPKKGKNIPNQVHDHQDHPVCEEARCFHGKDTIRFEIGGDDGGAIGGGGGSGGGCPRSPRGRHLSCEGEERQRRSSLRQHWDDEDDATAGSLGSQIIIPRNWNAPKHWTAFRIFHVQSSVPSQCNLRC